LQGALDPDANVSTADSSERQYLDRFFDQLRRYGSRRLRDRIDRYRSTVLALIETPLAALAHGHRREG
jgi:hypothetical protein